MANPVVAPHDLVDVSSGETLHSGRGDGRSAPHVKAGQGVVCGWLDAEGGQCHATLLVGGTSMAPSRTARGLGEPGPQPCRSPLRMAKLVDPIRSVCQRLGAENSGQLAVAEGHEEAKTEEPIPVEPDEGVAKCRVLHVPDGSPPDRILNSGERAGGAGRLLDRAVE